MGDALPRWAGSVVLRRLGPGDLATFQAYRRDPEVVRYQGWSAMSEADAIGFLEEMRDAVLFEPGVWCQLGIADAVHLGLIGDIGVCLSPDSREAEIGFTLQPQSQGRGLASAAVRAAIDLVFEQTEACRVIGVTDARNEASIRLLERVGMGRVESRQAVFRGESCV